MSTHPTKHANVRLSQHAVTRIADRDYSAAEIDAMLSSIDSRLVVHVITVLPRKKKGQKVSSKLTCARKTLAQCKRPKAIERWTKKVSLLEKQGCFTQEPALPASVKSAEDLIRLQASINNLRDALNRF